MQLAFVLLVLSTLSGAGDGVPPGIPIPSVEECPRSTEAILRDRFPYSLGRYGTRQPLLLGDEAFLPRIPTTPGAPIEPGEVHRFARRLDGEWSLAETIASPTLQPGGGFGWATVGEGDSLVITAVAENSAGPQFGSAWYYRRINGQWTYDQPILPPAGVPSHYQFGRAAALDGDLLVIGEPYGPAGSDAVGSAFVYRLLDGTWTFEATLVAQPPLPPGATFGDAIAVDDERIAVAAPEAQTVCVFTRVRGSWTETTRFAQPTGDPNTDSFATSVALRGDLLAVGAPNGFNQDGRIDIYRQAREGTWSLDGILHEADSPDSSPARIGAALAIRDGAIFTPRRVVTFGAGNSWNLLRYEKSVDTWGITLNTPGPVAKSTELPHTTVSVSGERALLTSPYAPFGLWAEAGEARILAFTANDDFDADGIPCAIDNCARTPNAGQEDADGDGVGDACDNCPDEANADQAAAQAQAAGDACSAAPPVYVSAVESVVTWTSNGVNDPFPAEVAIDGDFAAVGVPNQTLASGQKDGVVVTFRRTNGTWAVEQIIESPAVSGEDAQFGGALSISGNRLAIGGVHLVGTSTPHSGAVRIYERNATGWVFVKQIKSPYGSTNDFFGKSVVLVGDRVAIGASLLPNTYGILVMERQANGIWIAIDEHHFYSLPPFGFAARLGYDGSAVVTSGPSSSVIVGSDYVSAAGALCLFGPGEVPLDAGTARWSPDPVSGAHLGDAVALHEGLVAAGSPKRMDNGRSGAVDVFAFGQDGWTHTKTLQPDGSVSSPAQEFGVRVAVHDDVIIVAERSQLGEAGIPRAAARAYAAGRGWPLISQTFASTVATSPVGVAYDGATMLLATPIAPGVGEFTFVHLAPIDTDLNDDGAVDGIDLAILLGAWGGSGGADINFDGVVDAEDIALLLGTWGGQA